MTYDMSLRVERSNHKASAIALLRTLREGLAYAMTSAQPDMI